MNCNYQGTNCKSCDIDCKEETPEGTAIPTGANETNQLHDTTESDVVPEKVLKEAIELRERFQRIYSCTGVASIEGLYGVHLSEKSFLATFKEYEISPFGEYLEDSQYTEKLQAHYNGTVFFCIR